MKGIIGAFSEYVLKNLGLQVEPKAYGCAGNLPFFLQDLYSFYDLVLLEKRCLLAIPKKSSRQDELTPAAIRKHLLHMREITGLPCIYLTENISSYDRQRLIKHGVQFVIPGRQIYLPALGIDWVERCPKYQQHQKKINKQQLSPSSQAVVIYILLHDQKKFMSLKLARALKYTPMTITRALNEIEALKIGKTIRKGKERWVHFAHDSFKDWNQVLPFLKDPVKKRVWLKLDKKELNYLSNEFPLAGLSALAEVSLLSDPPHRIYAMSLGAWKSFEESHHFYILSNSEEANIQIEVWAYDPLLFVKDGRVDLYSLYLSLKDSGDERVEAALNAMLKG